MSNPEYKITEEDILAMMRHLRHVAPEYATPENAIKLIEQDKVRIEKLEELHPDLIEDILKDFETN